MNCLIVAGGVKPKDETIKYYSEKCELIIGVDKGCNYLFESKDEIESELGYEVEWISSENTKSSNISILKKTDVNNESTWEKNIKWHLSRAVEFYNVFADRIKNF